MTCSTCGRTGHLDPCHECMAKIMAEKKRVKAVEIDSSAWFSGRERRVDHRAYAYGMFSGAMAAVGVFAALQTSVALFALAFVLGIIGEAFRRSCPPKPSQPENVVLSDRP